MLNVFNIILTDDEMRKCREFSQRSANSQQAIEFGQRSTKERSTREIARDNLIGKIARKVTYRGAASLEKLKAGVPTTLILRKGSILPGTHTQLQADNYGIHFKNLYKHLNTLVRYLKKSPPPASLTDNYKNPYTGKTTIDILKEENFH